MNVTPLEKLYAVATNRTPFFAWDTDLFAERVEFVHEAFAVLKRFSLLYSVKANPSELILRQIKSMQVGVDVCSLGELETAMRAGIDARRIHICPYAPSDDELAVYAASGCQLDLDSDDDIHMWSRHSDGRDEIGLRVNPDVKAGFHAHCQSGLWNSKYGIPLSDLEHSINLLEQMNKRLVRIHIHIGSSSYNATPYLQAIERILLFIVSNRLEIESLNIGGGWGIPFNRQDDRRGGDRFPLKSFAKSLAFSLKKYGLYDDLDVIAEPGEYLVGPCGFIVTTVRRVYERKKGAKRVTIVTLDASTNLYPGAAIYHPDNFVWVLNRTEQRFKFQVLAGRSMLAGDVFGEARRMPILKPGDIIAIGIAGAYTFAKSNTFNSLPEASEVWIR